MHVFDTVDAFRDVMARSVRETLHQGLHGWNVTDCAVTMTHSDYQAPPRRWPGTTLSDYRLLTPLVLLDALARAGTTVCEPVLEVHLEVPADVLGPIIAVLNDVEAVPGAPDIRGPVCILDAEIRSAAPPRPPVPAARHHPWRRRARGELRRLPAGGRRPARTSPHRRQPARPPRLPPPAQGRHPPGAGAARPPLKSDSGGAIDLADGFGRVRRRSIRGPERSIPVVRLSEVRETCTAP